MEFAAVTGHVGPAHVVDENKDDSWLSASLKLAQHLVFCQLSPVLE
jgi:hypothetical protein